MKAIVHSQDTVRPELRQALLVYEDHDSAYVTVHRVSNVKGRATIGPGGPASRAALAGLAAKLSNATALAGFLPAELVYLSPRVIAWWRDGRQSARVFFDSPRHGDAQGLGQVNAVTRQPPLLFAVTGEKWYVWAMKENARPAPETTLHRAPHFNVWASGEICTGNVKLPERLDPQVTAEYERAFFGSNFTHPNDAKGMTRHKGGIYALWRELVSGKHQEFPIASLPPSTTTLAAAIKKLEEMK